MVDTERHATVNLDEMAKQIKFKLSVKPTHTRRMRWRVAAFGWFVGKAASMLSLRGVEVSLG